MKADFSGYATKNDLKCSDGRTIKAGSFQHQDKTKVPLVWQHMHNEPTNVLGHAILEHRQDGVYAYGYFNGTQSGQEAKVAVQHGDITALSIYANKLVQRSGDVIHGEIREVSLVLAGANPGAFIDSVSLAHGDGEEASDSEAIIYTGLTLEHADTTQGEKQMANEAGEETVQDVFDSLSEKQKNVVYYMIGQAVEDAEGDEGDDVEHGDLAHAEVHNYYIQEGAGMPRNVFDQNGGAPTAEATLSHSQVKNIFADAQKTGSLAESVLAHAQEYGIENIDILFPDAKLLSTSPEVIGRRQEWVTGVIDGARKSPIARIKSTAVDLTADEARAKGYVKGNLKKEEIIKLLKRVTTPTTIYKKQKLDRDDIVDITDLDVVAWLKAEMRVMLDEELARAILVGDGREADDEDKIDEDHLRPIATDADMYAHKITLQSNLTPADIITASVRARASYKGTGAPTFYTTEAVLTDMLLLTDKVDRRLYETEAALAAAMRVSKIETVEVMESYPDLVGIMVNMTDYTLGADKGGQLSMFDDFDIDYNQYKYLLETRVSGALTKPKSAVVIKRAAGNTVSPTAPQYDSVTKTITIPSVNGVIYKVDGETKNGKVVITETADVEAYPKPGFAFPAEAQKNWTFIFTA